MSIDVSTHTRDIVCATTQSRKVPARKRAIATRLFTLQHLLRKIFQRLRREWQRQSACRLSHQFDFTGI
jgi:hypothetical protein